MHLAAKENMSIGLRPMNIRLNDLKNFKLSKTVRSPVGFRPLKKTALGKYWKA